MGEAAVIPDRRQRRRQESIEEILDVALDVMAEQGVAGLSLGEVARRLGIRPPSLYVYFASKNDLYDAEFGRGAQLLLEVIEAERRRIGDVASTLEATLDQLGTTFITWALDNPVYSQLLFWRPVPGYEPSPEAYAPAVALMERTTAMFVEMQDRGWIRSDVPAADIVRDWTIVISGIVSQQLANEPDSSFASGRFAAAFPSLSTMFVGAYTTRRAAKSVRKS